MCTRPRRSGRAIISAIILFWRICCCSCSDATGTPPLALPCNVIADGRELHCRSAGLLAVGAIYDADLLRTVVPINITKM